MRNWATEVSMSAMAERHARALALFDELVELDAATRAARMQALRQDDAPLATELERMLAADAGAGGIIDDGLPRLASTLAADLAEEDADVAIEGRRVGPFELRQLLGRGGMGEVWLARRMEGDFSQDVALKLCRRGMGGEDMRRRFVQERRILAELSHPGIARFIDGGVGASGAPWFAMEYVAGASLTEFARDRHLDVRQRVALMAEVAEVVAYAQAHLVVHRDLKPSNILVDADGRVRLLDFGIAKLLQDDLDARETATGMRAMSPSYAAPEQVLGEPISTSTDVFALGVVLYELLTAALPHERSSASLEVLADSVRREAPLKPSVRLRQSDMTVAAALGTSEVNLQRFARTLAGELDTIVLTALRREPERRYASAAALADDLRRWLEGRTVAAQPDTASYRLRKFVGRNRIAVGSASGTLLALIVGFGTALWQAGEAREAARRADAEAESSERIANFALTMVREQYAYGRSSAQPRTPAQMLAASVDSARVALKDDDQARAVILGKLGELQSVVDTPARAESAVTEAMLLTRRLHGDNDVQTADMLVSLATVKEQGDQLADAEALLREALPIYRRLPGNERSQVMTRSRLASILRRTARVDEAIAELAAAREGAAVAYGIDHPNTIELIGNGAILLEQIDRLAEAEAAYRTTIAAYERIDNAFPRLANPLFNLGQLLGRIGHYAEARLSMQRALDIAERHSGAADPHRAVMVVRYAEFLRRIGDVEGAQALCNSIADVFQSRPAQQSRLLRLRAQLHADGKRHAEARVAFDAAGALLESASGDLRLERARAQLVRAEISILAQLWDEARAAAVSAHAQFNGLAQPPSDIRTELMRIDARLAMHEDDVQRAASLLDTAIATLAAVTGSETVEIAQLEHDLAEALDRLPLREAEAAKVRAASHARLLRLGVTPVWARS
jgi:serine/threonine-protein kinase